MVQPCIHMYYSYLMFWNISYNLEIFFKLNNEGFGLYNNPALVTTLLFSRLSPKYNQVKGAII